MNTNLLTAAIAALSLFSVTAAFAGPSDGLRPGVSPAPWLLPAEPKATGPYALIGEAEKRAKSRSSAGWRRELRRFGNKVERDIFIR